MDHQIQNHGNIIGPIGMGAVATRLKHHHLLAINNLDQFPEGRVEPFDMPHLQKPAGLAGRKDQGRGLILTGCNRLFDQHVQTCFKAGHPDLVVQQGWNCNADGLHRLNQLAVILKPTASELFSGQSTPG